MENPDDSNQKYAEEVHYLIGKQLSNLKLDSFFAIGKWAKEYVHGARNAGVSKKIIHYYPSVVEAYDDFLNSIIPGSVIVFKSSRYVNLKDLIHAVKQH